MDEQEKVPIRRRRAWSVESFERFWAKPDPELATGVLSDDVVGYWAGRDTPVYGKEDYTACIAALVDGLPGVYLTVAEHAADGEFTFIRWIMHATGAHGRIEFTGIDCVKIRDDGLVAENRIVCDTAAFEALAGKQLPWISLA
jgi:hypothetical protein